MGGLISGVEDIFGGASNNAGTVAQSANLIQPITQDQLNAAMQTATRGVSQQQALANALTPQGTQGIDTQSFLTKALIDQANGKGPNPAQQALANATGQNIANQAALMAGQRGAGANAGLLARQIANQGAGIQQNAAGQSALLQAQQQLAAQQQLQQLAGAQIGQQTNAVSNLNNAALTNQNQLLQALQGYNTNQVQNVASQNEANAKIATNNANNSAKGIGGLFQGLAGAGASLVTGGGLGGALKALADGGEIENDGSVNQGKQILKEAYLKKKLPPHLHEIAKIYHPKIMKMYCGGMAEGAVVPGEPKVPGKNTEKNDTVPALLTPKEIVLPLSVTQSSNPGEAAKQFVERIKGQGDFKQALREHVKKRKSKK